MENKGWMRTPVVTIGHVRLGRIPRVVLGVAADVPALRGAAKAGADLVEVRIDQFTRLGLSDVEAEVRSIRQHGLPLIGTVRSRKEGGQRAVPDALRIALYRTICPLVAAIDIELSSDAVLNAVKPVAQRSRKTLILSYHNFSKTPRDATLETVVERAVALGASVTKIATLAESDADVIRLFRFTLKHRAKHLVTMAMGAAGSISRLLFPLAGSLLTYTHVAPSHGQIPLGALVCDLRRYYPAFDGALIHRFPRRH